MQRGNAEGKATRYLSPHLIEIKAKMQKAESIIFGPPSARWFCRRPLQVLFAKGGTALSQRGVCQCATIASMP
jgi:hypothetical protein